MKLSTKYATIANNIVDETIRYLNLNPSLKSFVIGISGGIDSALTAALAKVVCDKTGIKLIGRSLPIESDKEEFNRAMLVGNCFCHDFEVVSLTAQFAMFKSEVQFGSNVEDEQEEKIRLGNIKARVRMIFLYDLAHRNNGVVLSTDNYSEYLQGFWTLHGDVGDFGMLQNLFKTEVYGLANFLAEIYKGKEETTSFKAIIDCVDAIPTDGLGITTSDYEALSVNSYEELDKILIASMNDDESYMDHPVMTRHLKTWYKRKNPFNIPRQRIVEEDAW